MSYEIEKINYSNKEVFYKKLLEEFKNYTGNYWFTNLSQCATLIFDQLPQINWVGFYLTVDQTLVLGPYVGKPACTLIHFGRGVCGTSAAEKKAIIVPNVDEFAGHIACDSASRSEVVIPLIQSGQVIGVLDVDSPELSRFDKDDEQGLSRIVDYLMSQTEFPISHPCRKNQTQLK